MTSDRRWSLSLCAAGVFGVAVTVALFELTSWDLAVQDQFFDFQTGSWLVDRAWAVPRAIFYSGIKNVIILGGLALIVLLAGPEKWRNWFGFSRRRLAVAVLTLACVPCLMAVGKETTNVFCPWDLSRYGGEVPYVKVLESFPDDEKPQKRGKGFPAGHASGGFALVGVLWLRNSRRWKRGWMIASVGIGWVMGTYQILKGAHFLSHTLVTMFAAWIIAAFWAWFLLWCADNFERQAGGPNVTAVRPSGT
jgi:membrane-associated PAP2 superfamily phosphatase